MNVDEQTGRNWATGCHIAALAIYLGIPFGNLLGPLLIWVFKKNEYDLVEDQGKEVLNFQISLMIYGFVLSALGALFFITLVLIPIAIVFLILIGCLFLFSLAMTIIGAIHASNGEAYRYPLTIRLIK